MPLIDFLNPYAYAMRIRRFAYRHGWLRSYSAGVPVISVGNLRVGGSGKSPMVLLIADYLEKKGKRVAIVSRGYKRRSTGFLLVRNRKEILVSVEDSGDEPQMFAQLLPNAIVIVDEDRVRGAINAKQLGAEVVILDDGFQHLRLKRELNILLTNGSVSSVLPFGTAREPVDASEDADIVVCSDPINSSDIKAPSKIQVRSTPDKLESFTTQDVPLAAIGGKIVLALSSIARPERFQNMLRELGATVTPFVLPDHAEYSEELMRKILSAAKKAGAEQIITTMKDAVKSRKYFEQASPGIPVLILQHKLEFLRGEQSFYKAIDQIV